MREEPGFADCAGRRLFTVLHPPVPAAAGPGEPGEAGAVLVHPFAEEKVTAHRWHVLLARELAARGVAVLRFDLSGHGDSEGEFEEATLERWVEETRAAADLLRQRRPGVGRLALFGARFGATIAALAAARAGVAQGLALLAPVTKGGAYMDHCLRANLTTQMLAHGKVLRDRRQLADDLMAGTAVNVEGYAVGGALYREAVAVDLTELPAPAVERALLLGLQGADAASRRDVEALAAKWGAAGTAVRAAEVRDEPPWKDPKIYGAGGAALREAVAGWFTEAFA